MKCFLYHNNMKNLSFNKAKELRKDILANNKTKDFVFFAGENNILMFFIANYLNLTGHYSVSIGV